MTNYRIRIANVMATHFEQEGEERNLSTTGEKSSPSTTGEKSSPWLTSKKSKNSSEDDQKIERKDRRSLSKYCHATLIQPENEGEKATSVLIQKEQYSGKVCSIELQDLKSFCIASREVEKKIAFLSLVKHKHEIGVMSTRRAEKSCKLNREIILKGKNQGILCSLFFPKSEDTGEASCKMTLLIKRVDFLNEEPFFTGPANVTLNPIEYRDLVSFLCDHVDLIEGNSEWRAQLSAESEEEDDTFQCAQGKPKNNFLMANSDSESEGKSSLKKGKKGKKMVKNGKWKSGNGQKWQKKFSGSRQGPYTIFSDDSD